MSWCTASPEGGGFVTSVTRFVDCQAETLGSAAYQALSAPGSTLAVLLTSFLTIFIAIIGYNLLLGRGFTVRSATLAMIKIGAVMALATSWPAYQTLVYDLVTDGPAQIASDISRPAGLPGSDGTLLQRLDGADAALVQLSVLGAGNPVGVPAETLAPPPFAGFNAFALGGSRIVFLVTAVAALLTVRVIAGLLLALGPFFIAFLMFDNTRSLFEGWVRVLVGAAIAAIGVSIALAVELALLEPWLAGILARRIGGEALPSVPTELFVIAAVFAIIVFAVLIASARVARGFRLAPVFEPIIHLLERGSGQQGSDRSVVQTDRQSLQERSRAAAVADVLVSLQRREANGRLAPSGGRLDLAAAAAATGGTQSASGRGTTYTTGADRSRARSRFSASSGKRDRL